MSVEKSRKKGQTSEKLMDPMESLPEAAAQIDLWDDLAASLVKISKSHAFVPEEQLLKFVDYLERKLSSVQYLWLDMFKGSPCPKLIDMIDVPLSHIPVSVYDTSVEWLDKFSIGLLCAFVVWSLNRLLTILEPPQQGGHQRRTTSKFHVAVFVALAMVLRNEPNTLVIVLPTLKEDEYQGHDKLPILVWMMAQASQGDLSVGLYSWSCNLLPVFYQENLLPVSRSNSQSMDLILQLAEMILSNLDARTILVNGTVIDKQRLISPYAFELLMRLTFPASSERVKATERFEAIYPLLKEVALACEPGSELMKQVTQQIFHYSLIIAGRSNSKWNL
ncbi:hypothetical protein ISN45_At03g011680 [Arabidopsis thaliana x Arabidopsis arenosa]|uniref:Uncharacterized protein n=1 Tax=Arabidopsis thaliana x Arabidopsis arenosa TaxID=1240361 RepID=A0A8T2ENS7_9BRAS|nr:hypothetical protein ISN45_At03g011680 [Arabidopsis thaliana x Arabidopsis arenosa]